MHPNDPAGGVVFNIMRYALHDGPGIRTTVFLKGCPLACWWCHNPESQDFEPALLYYRERCRLCGDCAGACPRGAIAIVDGALETASSCDRCGNCAATCVAEARQLAGRRMTVTEVLDEIERDVPFFDESGGGVTLSGGEPLAQPAFTEALLAACRERRIHTVLDTCGFAGRDVLLRVCRQADLVLYDLKLPNPVDHAAATGVPNEPIFENLAALAAGGRNVIVRVPVIPGVNDSDGQIGALAAFLAPLGLKRIDLLPYHKIGFDKYSRLRKTPPREALEPPSPEHVRRIASDLELRGFIVGIGG